MACVVVAVCVRACVCVFFLAREFPCIIQRDRDNVEDGELALSYTRQHLNVQWLGIVM